MAAQRLHIQNIILHRAGESQIQSHALVLKFGPENSRRIQKLHLLIQAHPLLGAGNAGPVLCPGGLPSCDLIDKGGFSHVRNSQNHHPQHPVLALLRVSPELLRQQLPDSRRELLGSRPGSGVGFQHREALFPEIRRPLPGARRIRLIHAVQHDQPGLARRQRVHIRIPAGHRNPGVQNLAHRIHIFQLLRNHPAGLGHMTGVPLNIHAHALCARFRSTWQLSVPRMVPIRPKSRFSVS